tara:strand:+ start:1095 stop:1445 length:351 start_codon:yes stop_codon:yes gene_type:complete
MNDIVIEYTGSYPSRCLGEWSVTVNDKKLDIGSDSSGEKDTSICYSTWHFEDWIDVWEDHEDGLDFSEWCQSEIGKRIIGYIQSEVDGELTYDEKIDIFGQVQDLDFRSSSCGGCI